MIRVPLTDSTLGDEEAEAAARVVRGGWVTMGREVEAFEHEFAAALATTHAIAVASGTAALHLAYEAAGLREGDEFALPALTFVATLNAGLYLRAHPVLIDCASEDDLTLSLSDLEEKLTQRTRLVVSMPYGGFCPDMDGLLELTDAREIPVVEDACHAPLAQCEGRMLGTFGTLGTFSFFGNKNLAIGEGGMVVTGNDEVAARVRLMRSHGMTTLTWDRHRGHATTYDVIASGYNYRLDEVRAAIGREQLKKLPENNASRTRASQVLREQLEALQIEGFKIPFGTHRGAPAHHLFPVLLPHGTPRDEFRSFLLERGVQSSVHYPPLHSFSHTQPYWSSRRPRLPVLNAIAERIVTLPMGARLSEDQIGIVTAAVADYFKAG